MRSAEITDEYDIFMSYDMTLSNQSCNHERKAGTMILSDTVHVNSKFESERKA